MTVCRDGQMDGVMMTSPVCELPFRSPDTGFMVSGILTFPVHFERGKVHVWLCGWNHLQPFLAADRQRYVRFCTSALNSLLNWMLCPSSCKFLALSLWAAPATGCGSFHSPGREIVASVASSRADWGVHRQAGDVNGCVACSI